MIKPEMHTYTKLTIVLQCWVLIRRTQSHLAAVSAGVSTRKLPVYLSRQFQHGTAVRSTWRSRYNRSCEHLTMVIRKDVFSHPFKSRVHSLNISALWIGIDSVLKILK